MKRKISFSKEYPGKIEQQSGTGSAGDMLVMGYGVLSVLVTPFTGLLFPQKPSFCSQHQNSREKFSNFSREFFQLGNYNAPNIFQVYLELNLGLRPTILKVFYYL